MVLMAYNELRARPGVDPIKKLPAVQTTRTRRCRFLVKPAGLAASSDYDLASLKSGIEQGQDTQVLWIILDDIYDTELQAHEAPGIIDESY